MKIIWRRFLTNPTTRIVSIDGDIVRLRVDGLVCSSVCAVRTRQALRRIDGVRRVSVDFAQGIATIEGKPADAATYERAVTDAVAGKPMRRLIERAAGLLQRSPASSDDGEAFRA
jgi:copper chaperone CopZ